MTGDQELTPGHMIIFDELIHNSFGSYSAKSGVLTAPFDGSYLISVNLCQFTGNIWTFFDIVQDGDRLATGYLGDIQ